MHGRVLMDEVLLHRIKKDVRNKLGFCRNVPSSFSYQGVHVVEGTLMCLLWSIFYTVSFVSQMCQLRSVFCTVSFDKIISLIQQQQQERQKKPQKRFIKYAVKSEASSINARLSKQHKSIEYGLKNGHLIQAAKLMTHTQSFDNKMYELAIFI